MERIQINVWFLPQKARRALKKNTRQQVAVCFGRTTSTNRRALPSRKSLTQRSGPTTKRFSSVTPTGGRVSRCLLRLCSKATTLRASGFCRSAPTAAVALARASPRLRNSRPTQKSAKAFRCIIPAVRASRKMWPSGSRKMA